MLFSNSIAAIALATTTQAFSFPSLPSFPTMEKRATCPAVWTSISSDLSALFVSGAVCTDDARATIRAVFHDCFPQGGCDGSIQFELTRFENIPMTATVNKLTAMATKYNVTFSDLLMFAGSSAVISCPGGPTTPTFIGRTDATVAGPAGQMPSPNISAADALSRFQAQGFSAQDLAALIGAHTASKEFNSDASKAGTPEDSTPGIWDILYYVQTILGTAPFTFGSDSNLAASSTVGPYMKTFSTSKSQWDAAFAPAMSKLELLGTIGSSNMIDCTSALPTAVAKRSQGMHLARDIINSLVHRVKV